MPRQRVRFRDFDSGVSRRGHHVPGGRGRRAHAHHRHAGRADFRRVPAGLALLPWGEETRGKELPNEPLTHLFDLSFIGRRDTVALEFEGRTYTFGEIDARSNRLAHLLRDAGLKTGDRLCVYLANCVEMIDLYLACVKLGVIFVPINILYREREIAHILRDAEPRRWCRTRRRVPVPDLAA